MLINCGSATEARAKVDAYLRESHAAGLQVFRSRFRTARGGGRYGGHPWRTNYMIIVVRGGGRAVDAQGQELAVEPGQAVFWPAGDWFAFDTAPGRETEALVLEGADLDPKQISLSATCDT